jgi:thioredoxin-related protein
LKRIGWFFAALVILATQGLIAQATNDDSLFEAQRIKFDPTRNPASDVQSAIIGATKEKKRIFLDVGGEWCSWCHRLDRFFRDQSDLDEYLAEHYVLVKVNFSKENKNEKFLLQFPEIDGYPHFFILGPDGKFLLSQSSGDFEAGKGYDHDKMMKFLKQWSL